MAVKILGYCGLDCNVCPVMEIGNSSDKELKEKTAREWSEKYKEYLPKELTADDIKCTGCKSDGNTQFTGCKACEIRKCAIEKNVPFCAQCGSFLSCEAIIGFFAYNPDAEINSNGLIKSDI